MNLSAVEQSTLEREIEELEGRYSRTNPKSRMQVSMARRVLPGGNTRIALYYDPFPVSIESAEGSRVIDVDGHSYMDFTNDLTAGFYGHSNPVIVAAIRGALDNGISFGGPHRHEEALAEAICTRFSSIERVRFCNSGTEANLMAMGLARAVTDRPLVLAFHGGYHGSFANYLDVKTPLNVDKRRLRFAQFNDEEDVRQVLEKDGAQTAAIIVEPMMGSGGGILARPGFLAALRAIADECGALLIFDEVQTARFSPGGLQDLVQVRADFTTLGKSLGGGLTFGAFGGRADLMDRLDPSRPGAIGHGGTFNNNVLTMIAGQVGLTKVATAEALHAANARGDWLRQSLLSAARTRGVVLSIGAYGSILSLHFQPIAPRNPAEIATTPVQRKLFHLDMLLRGFYVQRRGTINLSLTTTDEDCFAFTEAFGGFLDRYSAFLPRDKNAQPARDRA
ncbi:aspartate aminotransferase family protein [Mesorhizobium sp. LSHC412B00]|uniref:aspartate aminotransferase family protein n=1 Tax=Mesorhizobium sp. LSHC412B00 TaxID=1287285 RepID=UPI0003CE040A|nr:aminotransferase class III-fold pyridoxal phosphate-dependent enzyme [Mesorhizobium sp. LSHC412B00]ESX84842.1 glutamate-1-semialdehyde 2,1-aminomutase [Mesorhizobium sp. LSHC412B00]